PSSRSSVRTTATTATSTRSARGRTRSSRSSAEHASGARRGTHGRERALEVPLDERHDLGYRYRAAQLGTERRRVGVGQPARDDRGVHRQVHVAVERETVHRDSARDPDADRRDLSLAPSAVGGEPHARPALDPSRGEPEIGTRREEGVLERADVGDDVDGLGEPHDRIADELARAVPRDPAPAVDVDDRGAVDGALPRARALARRVDGLVLDEVDRVRPGPRRDLPERLALQLPHGLVRAKAQSQVELDEVHRSRLTPTARSPRLVPEPSRRFACEVAHNRVVKTIQGGRWVTPTLALLLVVWLGVGYLGGMAQGKLSQVTTNDQASFLPLSAESTRAAEVAGEFVTERILPGPVVVRGDGQITPEQLEDVQGFATSLAALELEGQPADAELRTVGDVFSADPFVVPSEDGEALLVTLSLDGDAADETLASGERASRAVVDLVRAEADAQLAPAGIESWLTGPAGFVADLVAAFGAIDGV